MSAKLAIEMLKVGVVFERETLGLTDVAPKVFDDGNDTLHLREAVQAAEDILERHAPSLATKSPPDYEKAAYNAATAALSPIDKDFRDCNQLQ